MATYVIGDVQGCFITLERLLVRIGFDASADRLWLAGDLVNRGPDSLGVLRWAVEHSDRVTAVLGNHDLHLLARAKGERKRSRRDTFDDVLEAPDRDELLGWLASLPLFVHRDGFIMVHAGLSPKWSLDDAVPLVRNAERGLTRGSLTSAEKDTVAVLTRIRTCSADGEMCRDYAGPPNGAPAGCRPWYELVEIPSGTRVLFGHWAALGLFSNESVMCLDTGCVWGRRLTALRLDDGRLFQEPSELLRKG